MSRRSTAGDRSSSGTTFGSTLAGARSRNAAKTNSRDTGELVGEVAQHEKRRLVGPVDVVENDNEAAPVGGGANCLGHLIDDPEAIFGRLGGTGEHRVGLDPERTQHLAPWPERRRALGLDATSPSNRGSAGESDTGEFLGESGLADSRLADAQDEPAAPLPGGVEPHPQGVELTAPADDRIDATARFAGARARPRSVTASGYTGWVDAVGVAIARRLPVAGSDAGMLA